MKSNVSTPYQKANRNVWFVNFYNFKGERNTPSLGTTDEKEAKRIALDLETILSNPLNAEKSGDCSDFAVYRPRAVKLALGLDADPVFKSASITLQPSQIEAISNVGSKKAELDAIAASHGAVVKIKLSVEELNTLKTENHELKLQAAKLEADLKQAIEELRDYKKRHAVDCKVTYLEALPTFLAYQSKRVANIYDSEYYNTLFGKEIGSKVLPEITAGEIDRFIVNFKGVSGGESQKTKTNCKKVLSTFWSWACKEYSIPINPMDSTDEVKQDAQKEPEALKDEALLLKYLDAHKNELYWHCWVSLACLLGTDWADTAKLEVKDFDNDLNEVRIIRRKTGIFRRCPIEQNYLKPILKKYIATLPKTQVLLFPNAVGGQWAASTWRKYYRDQENSVINRLQKDNDGLPWSYGPREWRHQGATTMGHCGFSTLQISQWTGNKEVHCRKHYLAHVNAKKWSFKYS